MTSAFYTLSKETTQSPYKAKNQTFGYHKRSLNKKGKVQSWLISILFLSQKGIVIKMKNSHSLKRTIIRIIIIVITITTIVLIVAGNRITDKDLSLFAAISGRRMINQGAEYVLVSKNPLQYMTKLSDSSYNYYEPVIKTLVALADEGYFSNMSSIETWGVIRIDGEIFEYRTRILGKGGYVVITIGESGVISPPTRKFST